MSADRSVESGSRSSLLDRPGARAPQALLVAVPPDLARGWCLEDVHACVEETRLLGRLRTLDLTDVPELSAVLPIPHGMS